MNKGYIDEFFKTGRLRLSSFSSYAQYECEAKGDKNEGTNIITSVDKRNNKTMIAVLHVGVDVYSLCTSTIYSSELKQSFQCDGVFRIKDPKSFGLVIASKIDQYVEGMQGHCIYQSAKTIHQEIKNLSFDGMKLSPDSENLDMQKILTKVGEIIPIDSYFTKPLRFQYQSEYRFIWRIQERTDDYLDIDCPEAIQFCERVE